MSSCRRAFCVACGEEMIHRDHRKYWESASALGQVVWSDAPRTFTVGDVDLYEHKWFTDGRPPLLRLLEHKTSTAALRRPQERALKLLDEVIGHCVACSGFAGGLDPRSGVFVVRGDVRGADHGRRKVILTGPQTIWNRRLGELVVGSQEDLFRWLDGADTQGAAA